MAPPLDKQEVTVENESTGKQEKVPALHPQFKEDIQFVTYKPPPADIDDRGSLEEWKERIGFIVEDIHWMLKLPHGKFWCQVVFDDTLHNCLDSYLRYAPRQYDPISHLPADIQNLHSDLHRAVFMLCLRMATHKESQNHMITPEVFGDILYENFIFDIPKIMDLCVLYGAGNGPLLSKMIGNIFTQQPKYEDDLRAAVPTMLQVFDNVLDTCRLGSESNFPQKLSDSSPKGLANMALAEFQDIVLYVADISATLLAFLDVRPQASTAFHQEGFLLKIASFYETLIPELKEQIKKKTNGEDSGIKLQLRYKLKKCQLNFARIFRNIIQTCCLQPIMESSSPNDIEGYVEDYLSVMTGLLNERRFLAFYEGVFPYQDDLDLLTQLQYAVDEMRTKFIQQGIQSSVDAFSKKEKPKKQKSPENISPGSFNISLQMAAAASVEYTDEAAGACAARVTGIQLDSLISSVKDLLPDLGEGFIELCLEELDYNVEAVINAVLEDKLPPSLEEAKRDLARQVHSTDQTPSVLDERLNVYDHDEFDVFNQERVDTSRIFKGKKEKTSKNILDDKSATEQFKPLYNLYGSVETEGSLYDKVVDQAPLYGDYDDEYDDTYDTNLIGADDADSADELSVRRPFTLPRVLGGGPVRQEEEEGDEEEEEEDGKEGAADHRKGGFIPFVEDPAKVRERQAQRWASKQAARGQRSHDVKGQAKGKGQDSEVLKNRAWKDKHKASRANHNRKAGADWKRSKGMGPLPSGK